jgi:hypothetical protein
MERGEIPQQGDHLEDARDDLPFQIHFELDDAPLSVWAFRVYAHLVRRSGRDGKIFPSYQTIGEKCFRSTYGPTANPKSLRNRAITAVNELVDAGLVTKSERTRKSTGQNDTNTYQLTPRRKWLGLLHEKRIGLEAQTEATQRVLRVQRIENKAIRKLTQQQGTGRVNTKATATLPNVAPETDAKPELEQADGTMPGGDGTPTMSPPGIPTMPPGIPTVPPPGIPTMPPGIPTVPEVSSIEVLQSLEALSSEGGGFSSTGNARADSQPVPHVPPAAVVDVPVPTTGNASLSKAWPAVTADGPSVAGAPDGATPDALVITDENLDFLFGAEDENAEGLDTVPGAAALDEPADVLEAVVLPAFEEVPAPASLAAPVLDLMTPAGRPASLPPLPIPAARIVYVDDLPAIPETELQGRPVAVPSEGKYKTIVGMVGGKNVIADGILESSSPSGGIPRVNWLRLNDDELTLIRTTAQAEAKRTEKSFLSLCILGLDRLIGAPKRTKPTEIVMNGKASVLLAPGALTPPPPDPATGRTLLGRWASRGNPAHIVEVIEVGIVDQGSRKQMRAILADGSSLSTADLVVRHTLLEAS